MIKLLDLLIPPSGVFTPDDQQTIAFLVDHQ